MPLVTALCARHRSYFPGLLCYRSDLEDSGLSSRLWKDVKIVFAAKGTRETETRRFRIFPWDCSDCRLTQKLNGQQIVLSFASIRWLLNRSVPQVCIHYLECAALGRVTGFLSRTPVARLAHSIPLSPCRYCAILFSARLASDSKPLPLRRKPRHITGTPFVTRATTLARCNSVN